MTTGKKSTPVDAYVGSRIRWRRNMLDMSQTELGHRIGVTFQQVQKYEKGVNRVGASRLQQIADVMETTPNWFFEGAPGIGAKRKPSAAARAVDQDLAAFLADSHAPRLMRSFVKLPPRLKRSIVALIVTAAGETESDRSASPE
jgi:transcriptional regulator with XRE-family HTH domain